MSKATAMNVTAAIGIMKQSKSVDEWNANRESIKNAVTQKDWFANYFQPIDASGLIVSVLGKDTPRSKRYNS